MLNIVWYKRDLRVHDHAALVHAAESGPVMPLYIVEPALWRQSDGAARHWDFISECLEELRRDLGQLGQPLVVRIGDAVETFSLLQQQYGAITIYSHEETGNGWTFDRDKRVLAWARDNGTEWQEFRQCGVIRRLQNRNGWAKRWDEVMRGLQLKSPTALAPLNTVEVGSIPTAHELGLQFDPMSERQRGGRKAGQETLGSFLTTRGARYRKSMSAPADGAIHCSRLSPFLAHGALSMREVTQAAWRRQQETRLTGEKNGWRGSLRSFTGRLHWRDHFMQKLEDEPRLEFEPLHRAYEGLRSSEPDPARLQAWSAGETGLPFVDACMRSLTATGWLNFRMRAMLVAVSSYHLWLDWRHPGTHLARCFVDYEPGIHWSQMQMQSGTTGINTIRIYNPVKQGIDQDPQGTFIRKWVPELATIPNEFIHEPWRADAATAVLGRVYPFPIVDHLESAKSARKRVWAVRSGNTFRDQANAIQDKHGSRKSGIRNRGQRPKRRVKDDGQLTLPL